jgi:myo-inositol-1(or 4)-monophosphatase
MSDSTNWLELCRRVVDAQRKVFEGHRGISARTVYDGVGEGGDRALVIDRLCEDAALAELEQLGVGLTVISEERGEVELSGGGPPLVVLDPIDGSLNARRTLPTHCLSVAVARGDSMGEVEFGYIYDFGAGEEYAAGAGGGATLNGERLSPPLHDGLEVVGIESAEPGWILPAVESLRGEAYRIRAVGSIAASLSYVAAGRFDAMLSARPARSVDAAAGQLIVREAGGRVSLDGRDPGDAGLGLDERYHVAAALGEGSLAVVLAAQGAVPEAS